MILKGNYSNYGLYWNIHNHWWTKYLVYYPTSISVDCESLQIYYPQQIKHSQMGGLFLLYQPHTHKQNVYIYMKIWLWVKTIDSCYKPFPKGGLIIVLCMVIPTEQSPDISSAAAGAGTTVDERRAWRRWETFSTSWSLVGVSCRCFPLIFFWGECLCWHKKVMGLYLGIMRLNGDVIGI